MKAPDLSTGQAQLIVGILGVGVAVWAIYETKKAALAVKNGVVGTATAVGDYIANDKNVVNGAAKSVFGQENLQKAFDGFFDFFHPDMKAAREKADAAMTPTLTTESNKPLSSKPFRG